MQQTSSETGFFDISPILRVVGEELQVALADRRRLVAIRREHIDEDVGRSRQDAAVMAETMHYRVANGQKEARFGMQTGDAV
ncbi:MAG: hypothetical protein VX085_11000 [Pseudomonadota bacterium]|nr:hypothetical protein [Pseudomonadota bacterium]